MLLNTYQRARTLQQAMRANEKALAAAELTEWRLAEGLVYVEVGTVAEALAATRAVLGAYRALAQGLDNAFAAL